MSSPVHHAYDLDPALRYAPRRVRQQGQPTPEESSPPPVDWPWRREDGNGPDFSGDRQIVEMRRRLALEPEWVPEPPQSSVEGRDLWKITLWAGAVLIFAALTAWVVVSIPGARRIGAEIVQASFPPTSTVTNPGEPSPSSVATNTRSGQAKRDLAKRQIDIAAEPLQVQEPTSRRDPAEPASSTTLALADATSRQPALMQAPTPAAVITTSEPSPAPQRAAPDFVTRQLDRDELASMLQRADDFIKSGDLSSARLLLRRAAEAGDVPAALTLAGTFDPNVLKTLGFQEGTADIAMARLWYERAEKFGSAEAPRRLQLLAPMINSAQ